MAIKKQADKRKAHKTTPVHAAPKQPTTQQKAQSAVQKSQKQYAVGRRKRAIARVYWHTSPDFSLQINNKDYTQYFPYHELQKIVLMPFDISSLHEGSWKVIVIGGGKRGQAESVRLGISRIFAVKFPDIRPQLKKAGLLRRDSRIKERKKYGLKRARRAPQWQKR